MTAELAWELFLETGLPEAYSLYCFLREEEARVAEQSA